MTSYLVPFPSKMWNTHSCCFHCFSDIFVSIEKIADMELVTLSRSVVFSPQKIGQGMACSHYLHTLMETLFHRCLCATHLYLLCNKQYSILACSCCEVRLETNWTLMGCSFTGGVVKLIISSLILVRLMQLLLMITCRVISRRIHVISLLHSRGECVLPNSCLSPGIRDVF